MTYNAFYTLHAPTGKSIEVPHKTNPFDARSMKDALIALANGLPEDATLNFGLECVGIRVSRYIDMGD